ncbi:MAG: hypothetical protein ABSC06_20105 [Rhodopila sp.]
MSPDAAKVDAPTPWPGDEAELLGRLVREFEDSEESSADSRHEAERSRDFHDGRQWTAEEAAILRRRRQPVVWNNVIGRKVELLRGLERRGRSDPEAFPRNPVDNVRADAATQALRYISDENRFDVIRSAVYDQMLVEGFSGAEVIVEEQQDGDGYDVVINHIPWERLYYDPHSQHPAFTDAMYLGIVIWMDRETAEDMYPGCEDILSTTLEESRSDTYDDKPRATWGDYRRRRVRVAQHHWKKRKDWWTATFTKGGFLEPPMLSPYKDRHGNATCPLILRSARIDRDNNRFGIVRDMVPLQESINKRESKLLHALSVNQIIMEEGAVADVDRTRSEAAKPDGVIVKNRGFDFEIHKDQAEIAGQFELLQYAVAQMNVMGANAAMAGKDPREQSGRAIIAQQSGGQMENEPMADSLRQWTHKVYEACWMRVRQFWTGPRWIRVTDSDKNTQFVGLNHPVTIADLLGQLDQTSPLPQQLQALSPQDRRAVQIGMQLPPGDPRLQTVVRIENDIGDMDCTITVEEGPDNPTMAAEQFQQIMQLPPQILMQFPPEFIIQASTLRNKAQLVKMLEEHAQTQAQAGQSQQANAAALQAAQVAKVQADAADKQAQATQRLHEIALDHAGQPGQVADAQLDRMTKIHGMALDHAAAQQPPDGPPDNAMMPPPAPPPDPLAVRAQGHDQALDRAKLGLAAQAQVHGQALDRAKLGLAAQAAMRSQQPPAGPAGGVPPPVP